MSKAWPLIAVVDDEKSVGKALNRLLRSAGMKVETFTSGAQFLKSLQNHTPDCVVLDLHMPQMNGFEVQSGLARTGGHTPVVVITGSDTQEARECADAGGATAYLLKPVDGQALLDAIAVAMAPAPETRPPPSNG